jgi:hypothetical protein
LIETHLPAKNLLTANRTGTDKLWIYDLRTNKHFTLKENPLKRSDLDDFVACYNSKNRHERKESERFKSFTYEELTKRDKRSIPFERARLPWTRSRIRCSRRKAAPGSANLYIFWLKDDPPSPTLRRDEKPRR